MSTILLILLIIRPFSSVFFSLLLWLSIMHVRWGIWGAVGNSYTFKHTHTFSLTRQTHVFFPKVNKFPMFLLCIHCVKCIYFCVLSNINERSISIVPILFSCFIKSYCLLYCQAKSQNQHQLQE